MPAGLCHLSCLGTGNMHPNWFSLPSVVQAQSALAAVPQADIRSQHFRDDQARSHASAQLPERAIGDAGHGRENHRATDAVWAYLKHGRYTFYLSPALVNRARMVNTLFDFASLSMRLVWHRIGNR